jgi:hypothetical protein
LNNFAPSQTSDRRGAALSPHLPAVTEWHSSSIQLPDGLSSNNTPLLSHSFVVDGASRMTDVSGGTYQAGYSRPAKSALISQVTHRSNNTRRMTGTKSYHDLIRVRDRFFSATSPVTPPWRTVPESRSSLFSDYASPS